VNLASRSSPLVRIVRFGVVGVLNTGVYFGLYLLFRNISHYLVAHAAAFLGAMVVSYFLNCYFTFRTRPTLRKFLLFPLSNATNFVIQTGGLYLLVDVFGMNERYAPLPAAAVAIPVTFLVAQLVLTDRTSTGPADAEVQNLEPAAERAGQQEQRH
jgi:putative flippase GtrA